MAGAREVEVAVAAVVAAGMIPAGGVLVFVVLEKEVGIAEVIKGRVAVALMIIVVVVMVSSNEVAVK